MPINCPICLNIIDRSEEIWACYRCEVLVHMSCMPRNRGGAVSTVNGCPGCRYTEQQAILEAEMPCVPPLGVWCSMCWKWVRWGQKVVVCQAPDEMCLGHTHEGCYRGRCGACGMNTRQALRERRDRKLELFKTKM